MPTPSKWVDTHYVHAYRFARTGMTNQQIAQALGVNPSTFKQWLKKYPALQDAVNEARKPDPDMGKTFGEYIYKCLPPELHALWEEISLIDGDNPNGRVLINNMLNKAGKRARQHLFVHAWVAANFNASEACRQLGVHRTQFESWQKEPEFAALCEEVMWHKSNFFETALIDLVEARHPSTVIFANKTFNRGRGYGEHIKVEHAGEMTVGHQLDELNLSKEVRRELLAAIGGPKAHLQDQTDDVIDAEYTEVGPLTDE